MTSKDEQQKQFLSLVVKTKTNRANDLAEKGKHLIGRNDSLVQTKFFFSCLAITLFKFLHSFTSENKLKHNIERVSEATEQSLLPSQPTNQLKR
jgi:hypothetical protein